MNIKTLRDIITGMDDNIEIQIRQDGIIKPLKLSGFTKEKDKTIFIFNI